MPYSCFSQELTAQLRVARYGLDKVVVVDLFPGRDANGSHGRLEQQEVHGRPLALGDVVEVPDQADDLGCVVQVYILCPIKYLVFNRVLPVEQVDVLLQTVYPLAQLEDITAALFEKLNEGSIDLI